MKEVYGQYSVLIKITSNSIESGLNVILKFKGSQSLSFDWICKICF